MATQISPLAYVHPDAKIGDDVTIDAFAYIDAGAVIGDSCHIHPHTVIKTGVTMGRDNIIYPGCVIGADPQDFRWKGEKTRCVIGDGNKIHEHVIINRSIRADKATRIGSYSHIMAQSHVGHDSVIGDYCVLGNGVKVAGDVTVGNYSILSSGVIVHEGFSIGEWVLVKGGCRVTGNVPPFVIMAHNPITYYGVNAYLMRKGHKTEQDIDDIAKCYRHIYQCNSSLRNAVIRIREDIADTEVRNRVLEFIDAHDMKLAALPDFGEY